MRYTFKQCKYMRVNVEKEVIVARKAFTETGCPKVIPQVGEKCIPGKLMCPFFYNRWWEDGLFRLLAGSGTRMQSGSDGGNDRKTAKDPET